MSSGPDKKFLLPKIAVKDLKKDDGSLRYPKIGSDSNIELGTISQLWSGYTKRFTSS